MGETHKAGREISVIVGQQDALHEAPAPIRDHCRAAFVRRLIAKFGANTHQFRAQGIGKLHAEAMRDLVDETRLRGKVYE